MEREQLAFDIGLYHMEAALQLESPVGDTVQPGDQLLRPELQYASRWFKKRRGGVVRVTGSVWRCSAVWDFDAWP